MEKEEKNEINGTELESQLNEIHQNEDSNYFEASIRKYLEKEDSSRRKEFITSLKEYLKPVEQEKMDRFEEEQEKDTEEKEHSLEDAKKDARKNTDVDTALKDAKEEEEKDTKKDDEDKVEAKDGDFTLRQQILITMYTVTLEKYYDLKEKILKKQIKEDSLSVSDEEYNTLTLYEMYLRDIDNKFASLDQSYGKHIIELSKETSKKEEEFVKRTGVYTKAIMDSRSKSTRDIELLKNSLEKKAEEITKLNLQNAKGESKDYEVQYNNLIREYLSISREIKNYEPDVNKMLKDQEAKVEEIESTDRNIGIGYLDSKEKAQSKNFNPEALRNEESADEKADDLGLSKDEVRRRASGTIETDTEGELKDSKQDIDDAHRNVVVTRSIEDRFGDSTKEEREQAERIKDREKSAYQPVVSRDELESTYSLVVVDENEIAENEIAREEKLERENKELTKEAVKEDDDYVPNVFEPGSSTLRH